MLATAADVRRATELTVADIRLALKASGYDSTDIIDSRFLGFNGASFIYEITFPGGEEEIETGRVYVKIVVSNKTSFTAEF